MRDERAAARSDLELAATVWLTEINRINLSTRDASLLIAREQADAALLLTSIERQALEADAARITAEAAEEACVGGPGRAGGVCRRRPGRRRLGPSTAPSSVPLTAAIWDREGGHQPEIVRLAAR